MATHSSILAWRFAWTEETDKLQSVGSQRVRHDRETNTLFTGNRQMDTEMYNSRERTTLLTQLKKQ